MLGNLRYIFRNGALAGTLIFCLVVTARLWNDQNTIQVTNRLAQRHGNLHRTPLTNNGNSIDPRDTKTGKKRNSQGIVINTTPMQHVNRTKVVESSTNVTGNEIVTLRTHVTHSDAQRNKTQGLQKDNNTVIRGQHNKTDVPGSTLYNTTIRVFHKVLNKTMENTTESNTIKLFHNTTDMSQRHEKMVTSENVSSESKFDMSKLLKGGSPPGLLLLPENWKQRKPLIPHILHQHWDSHSVPKAFRFWIKSWIKHHPTWEYWFWTPADVRLLLQKHFPQYLKLYNAYPMMLNKADVMRYFIMYQYGGVYMDLDMESLRPMDNWTYNIPCFASEENYEHAFFLYRRKRSELMNTFIACRPKHPFFKYMIGKLPEFAKIKNELYSTGPFFLDETFLAYNRGHNGQQNLLEMDRFIDVRPEYWLPTYDFRYNFKSAAFCSKRSPLTSGQQQVCADLKRRNFSNTPRNYSYGNHHWFHVLMMQPSFKSVNTVSIQSIVPHVKFPKIT